MQKVYVIKRHDGMYYTGTDALGRFGWSSRQHAAWCSWEDKARSTDRLKELRATGFNVRLVYWRDISDDLEAAVQALEGLIA